MTNMLKKVFNWSEVHLSEMTCYKIHTLDRTCHGLQENNFQVNQLYNVTWSNVQIPLWGPAQILNLNVLHKCTLMHAGQSI